MYKKGDIVMYTSQGVCKITDIVTQEIDKVSAEYYVLQPLYSNTSKLYIPLSNEALIGRMRRVVTKEEINSILDSLPEYKDEWIENDSLRKEHYKQVLASADRVAVLCMLREIYAHKIYVQFNGKKLHTSDERFYKEAEKMLCEEFALVLNVDTKAALEYIKKRLGFLE